jgi:hypothetical protein
VDGLHLIGKPTVGGVNFHRGGLEGGEPSRKDLAQRRLQRKRRAVVDHDLLEARHGSLPLGREGLAAQVLHKSHAHAAHEHGEARPREAIVERLVRHVDAVLVVERAEQVRERFDLRTRKRADNREKQPMGGDGA